MMLDWKAAIECPNPSCILGKHIPLPYSNLQQIIGNQPNWPKSDWRAFVLCRECGSGRIYSRENVRWGVSQEFGGLWAHTSFLQIELKCDRADCEFPIRVHMLFDKVWKEHELKRKLQGIYGDPQCQDGHHLQNTVRITGARSLHDFGEAAL